MKYKFGDTLIKNNRAYIVLGEGGVGEYHQYYLQTRSGTLLIRGKKELDNLINKRGYKLYKSHCNPVYPDIKDFNIGDLVIGRRWDYELGKYTKQTGIVMGIRRKKYGWLHGYTKQLRMLWSNGEHEDCFWPSIDCHFVAYSWRPITRYYRWKHIPVVK